jgi:cardiolipin synthase
MTKTNIKLLVDSEEFWNSLRNDLAGAEKSAYIQTLSFEGDPVGLGLSQALTNCKARDKRIIVDQYTRYIINDKVIFSPGNLLDRKLRAEVRATRKMIDTAKRDGIEIKWVNPVGFLMRKFVARNHKKMALVDNKIVYLGGINFSEHNFEWHDMMLRIESEEIASFFAADFLSNWNGQTTPTKKSFGNLEFIMFDGYRNEELFERIFELLASAKKSIFVESPYLTFPFFEILGQARKRGVEVTIITPENNNKAMIKQHILYEADRLDLNVQLYRGVMTHLKAMLIDDETLIMGSTNFDYLSYTLQQEIAAIVTDKDIVNDFIERVIKVDLANSFTFTGNVNHKKGFTQSQRFKSLGRLLVKISRL